MKGGGFSSNLEHRNNRPLNTSGDRVGCLATFAGSGLLRIWFYAAVFLQSPAPVRRSGGRDAGRRGSSGRVGADRAARLVPGRHRGRQGRGRCGGGGAEFFRQVDQPDGAAAAVGAAIAHPEAETQASGTGHLHPAAGQPAQLRHAADRSLAEHDASGIEGHRLRSEQGAPPGSDGRAQSVGCDVEAAGGFFRSVYQHGAGRGIERRAGGRVAPHGHAFPTVCRSAGQTDQRDDLSDHGLLRGNGSDSVLHLFHAAAFHRDVHRIRRGAAAADAHPDLSELCDDAFVVARPAVPRRRDRGDQAFQGHGERPAPDGSMEDESADLRQSDPGQSILRSLPARFRRCCKMECRS